MSGWMERIAGLRIVALVAVLLLVQFGLVQHAIEHLPSDLDVACEYCAAGHQPGAPIAVATTGSLDSVPATTVASRDGVILPAGLHKAHRARAPPHHS